MTQFIAPVRQRILPCHLALSISHKEISLDLILISTRYSSMYLHKFFNLFFSFHNSWIGRGALLLGCEFVMCNSSRFICLSYLNHILSLEALQISAVRPDRPWKPAALDPKPDQTGRLRALDKTIPHVDYKGNGHWENPQYILVGKTPQISLWTDWTDPFLCPQEMNHKK